MIEAPARPTIGAIIRFKNSAATLPGVLAALRRQTVQPDLLLGIDSGAKDNSRDLLTAAGARILDWTAPYHHSRVLNFAVANCPTDLVLVLSSHTVLDAPDAIERLRDALADPRTACASARWDADPYYSEAVDWPELQRKGLKFGSIYSNSMGMFRRRLWEELHFDESISTMEDGVWAVEQLKRGHVCRRLAFDFRYQRSTTDRTFIFSAFTFRLADQHGLRVAWLGPGASLRALAAGLLALPFAADRAAARQQLLVHRDRLRAWLYGRRKQDLKE
jgi:hypothetical protein